MGDAGPPTPPPEAAQVDRLVGGMDEGHNASLREIKVLITGFGVGAFSFQSFVNFLFESIFVSCS